MSSHHFVKEGQEPALLILDALDFEIAGPLLEWAPLVIVAQNAVEDVLLWNIKMDVVLSKEESVRELTDELSSQAPLTILAHGAAESPLVNALYFLISKKQTAVNIFASDTSGTILLAEPFAERLQISVMDGNIKWSGVANGHFEKWLSSKSSVHLRPSQPQQSFSVEGLKQAGDHYENESDGMIFIHSPALFWVGEYSLATS